MENDCFNIPIGEVLEALGAKRASRNMYYSTFRRDSNPSMSVNFSKNVWYDHGVGKGGGPVELVMETLGCTFKEAVAFLSSLHGEGSSHLNVPGQYASPEEEDLPSGINILSVRPLTYRRLLAYGKRRGISKEVLTRYCTQAEIEFRSSGKKSLFLSFENNSGGYVLRSCGKMKICSKAGISTFDSDGERSVMPSSDTVTVFEGLFDFLSWKTLSLEGKIDGEGDSVVLNSVSNLEKAVPFIGQHSRIISYLDNDEAGRKCLHSLRDRFPGAEILDMTEGFGECKDLNEVLMLSEKDDFLKDSDKKHGKTLPETK